MPDKPFEEQQAALIELGLTVTAAVKEHLVQVDAHLQKAVSYLTTPLPQAAWEVSTNNSVDGSVPFC